MMGVAYHLKDLCLLLYLCNSMDDDATVSISTDNLLEEFQEARESPMPPLWRSQAEKTAAKMLVARSGNQGICNKEERPQLACVYCEKTEKLFSNVCQPPEKELWCMNTESAYHTLLEINHVKAA